jgi:hypothetical protein
MYKKLLAMLAGVICVSAVFAQGENVRPVQGDKYVGGGGQWLNAGDNDIAHFEVNLGFYFHPQIVGELDTMYIYSGSHDQWAVALMGKYLLTKDNPTVPYLQVGGVYYKTTDENDTTFIFGGGVDYFIKPNQAFYLDFKACKPDVQDDDWVYVTSIGFRYAFK